MFVYTHNGLLFCHKKELNLAVSNMDGPWGHYAKWDRSDTKKQIPYDLTYGIQKEKKNNNQIYRYTEQKQIGGCQRSEFEGRVGEMGKGSQKIQNK